MKSHSLLVLSAPFIFLINLRTCSSLPEYGVADRASTATYLSKPAYTDSVATAWYATGSYQRNECHHTWQEGDLARSVTGGLGWGRSGRWISAGVQTTISTGKYYVFDAKRYRHDYEIYTWNGSANAAFCLNSGHVNWRLAGAELGQGLEWGPYSRFRQRAALDSVIFNVDPRNIVWHVAVSSEILYCHNDKTVGFGFRYGGFTGEPMINMNLLAGYKRFNGYLQIYTRDMSLRSGYWQAGIAYRMNRRM